MAELRKTQCPTHPYSLRLSETELAFVMALVVHCPAGAFKESAARVYDSIYARMDTKQTYFGFTIGFVGCADHTELPENWAEPFLTLKERNDAFPDPPK